MITNSMISYGDQLGAQMSTIANLYYIAKENNQDIVFFTELINFRRGIQPIEVFDMQEIRLINTNNAFIRFLSKYMNIVNYDSLSWKSKMNRIYGKNFLLFLDKVFYLYFKRIIKNKGFHIFNNLFNNIHTSNELLHLDKNSNYDIQSGFGTYQDWKKYENEIISLFSFKQYIIDEAHKDKFLIDIIKNNNSVSIHFRLTDYLVMSSLNLKRDYYINALKFFKKNDFFVIFSDDINAVKQMNLFSEYKHVFYVENKSVACDLYYMSLCKNNIIANSSFSFWGGVLNKNNKKVVVCPYRFIGNSAKEAMYMNGNYYPDSWKTIDN